MAIYPSIVDFDSMFAKLSMPPIIVNNFDLTQKEEIDRLNSLLYVRYEGDTLNVLPSCNCESLQGEFNVGLRCRRCGTEVISVTEKPLESSLWIATPAGVKTLINPAMWIIIGDALTQSSCNILEWLCNPSYKPGQITGLLAKVQQMGFTRGLNYFHDNFDVIIKALFDGRIVKGSVRERTQLWEFIQKFRKEIFCKHLPVPSRLAFITEATAGAVYADSTMAPAIDAIRTITGIESGILPPTQRVKEMRTVKCIVQLSQFYWDFAGASLGSKRGMLRQHVFGGRPHWSGRAVISSIHEPHMYDECHLPWGLACSILKVHLTNKMLKIGHSPNEINRFLSEHVNTYHPLLDKLFQELIDEAPGGAIPIILQRNPSLKRGSAQALRVTQIRKDPNINTIGISVLCLVAPNADQHIF